MAVTYSTRKEIIRAYKILVRKIRGKKLFFGALRVDETKMRNGCELTQDVSMRWFH